ncbi:hypothetical protein AMK19_10510 [Kitasatospora sp. CB01950]|nr:hypothetical protein AMK19_10510 [Kitasatospora sp. CB01950]
MAEVPRGHLRGPWVEPQELYTGTVVRPYIDHGAWLGEQDEMRREYDERQRQRERRAALRAVVLGLPDPGYTYPGAHALAGRGA